MSDAYTREEIESWYAADKGPTGENHSWVDLHEMSHPIIRQLLDENALLGKGLNSMTEEIRRLTAAIKDARLRAMRIQKKLNKANLHEQDFYRDVDRLRYELSLSTDPQCIKEKT